MVQREMVLRRDGRSLVRFGRIAGVLVVMMVSTLWYASQRPGPVGAQVVPSARAKGSVNLFYAGSLVGLVTQDLGPAFHKATGYTINGLPGGSGELANEIKTGAQKADVFLSAAPSADLALEGTKNGNWLHWYLPLGETPLLIGYNPHSRYAHLFRSEPWWKVLETKGFLLGRTDPALDPKGALTVQLVRKEAGRLHDPALVQNVLGSSENPAQVFPEETLVSRLQAGQLDAGFFFGIEARVAKLPTVSTGITLYGSYTVSIVRGAPDTGAAEALVRFLYSPEGQRILKANGVQPVKPHIVGSKKAYPKALRSLFARSKR